MQRRDASSFRANLPNYQTQTSIPQTETECRNVMHTVSVQTSQTTVDSNIHTSSRNRMQRRDAYSFRANLPNYQRLKHPYLKQKQNAEMCYFQLPLQPSQTTRLKREQTVELWLIQLPCNLLHSQEIKIFKSNRNRLLMSCTSFPTYSKKFIGNW